MSQRYLTATPQAGLVFALRRQRGPVYMLNLLRYRKQADYSGHAGLAPASPTSGEAAFQKYLETLLPLLKEQGGEVTWKGKGGPWLVGPEGEGWDEAVLLKHASVRAFLKIQNDPAYQAASGHRLAALEDSRLLPLSGE